MSGKLIERKTLSRKLKGAVGIGTAVATLAVWILHQWKPSLIVPDEVVAALAALVTLTGAAIGGWSFTERSEA